MYTTIPAAPTGVAEDHRISPDRGLERASACFGLAFAVCQLAVLAAITVFVLPRGGPPQAPADERGGEVLAAAAAYRLGNAAFMLAGILLVGFLGVVHTRLRAADRSGVLATVAVASGTLVTLIWPLSGMLHDVALETAQAGADVRILAGWDAVAPFSLAFSALLRVFFLGAITIALHRADRPRWLVRFGVGIVPLSLVGSATLVCAALFPVLALSTVAFQIWIGLVAWHWLRRR